MLVSYIQNKSIDFDDIKKILQKSRSINQYSNNGPVKRELEKFLEKMLKVGKNKSVVCFSSGTAACHALMYFFEKKAKKEIVWAIPDFTFPSPIVNKMNAKIFDIDSKSYTIPADKNMLADCDGVILTNLFGSCVEIDAWEYFCEKNDKILILDNASSPLSLLRGKNISTLGDATFGSLHHTKYLGFGEGGFAVIDSKNYRELNSITNFGFKGRKKFNKLASNYKLSDISAAFCLSHLKRYNIKEHVDIQKIFIKNIENIPNVSVFNFSSELVYGNLPILFDENKTIDEFRSVGIEVNKYYKPLAGMKNSTKLYRRIINFPLYSDISEYQVELMINAIKESVSK